MSFHTNLGLICRWFTINCEGRWWVLDHASKEWLFMDTTKGRAYSIWDRCEYKQKVWFTWGIYAFIYNAPGRNRRYQCIPKCFYIQRTNLRVIRRIVFSAVEILWKKPLKIHIFQPMERRILKKRGSSKCVLWRGITQIYLIPPTNSYKTVVTLDATNILLQ